MGCSRKDHDIDECGRLHLVLNKSLVLAKHIYSCPH
jgi:hypothetical protein